MASKPATTVASAADAFEVTLKDARIDDRLHDGLWDIWVGDPDKAQRLVAHFKDNGRTPAMIGTAIGQQVAAKLKQAADVIDMALARYREAAVAVAQQAGDQAVAADIEQQREDLLRKYGQSADGAGAGTATSSGEGSKQKTYDPRRDPFAIAAQADQLKKGSR